MSYMHVQIFDSLKQFKRKAVLLEEGSLSIFGYQTGV